MADPTIPIPAEPVDPIPNGSVGLVQIAQMSTPNVDTVAMGPKLSESSYTFPAGTTHFSLRARLANQFRVSYQPGFTTEYWTANKFYTEQNLDPAISYTVYFQSIVASDTMEILSWS